MKNKFMLKSGILFLVIALLIGGIATVSLANNYGSRKGNNGTAEQNQSQLQECDGVCDENKVEACEGECDGTCDGNQIKISGAELKAMTIADIAKLWGIDDASSLLNEIIDTFNLKNAYTAENTIDELRGEIRFSPFQIKEIADKLIVS